MRKISQAVEEIIEQDEVILSLGEEGLINLSSYARKIRPSVESIMRKEIKEGSILAALTRFFQKNPKRGIIPAQKHEIIQTLSVHSNLEGMTFERTERASSEIRALYQELDLDHKTFFTLTQGVTEITLVCDSSVAAQFRKRFKNYKKIYDKKSLVGLSVKFDFKYLAIPNTIFELYKKLAFKKVNIIEIISTATEITFVIEKEELPIALDALQKNIY